MLKRERFVQIILQLGCYVSQVTLVDTREIMQVREALEGMVAGMAALFCDREKLNAFKTGLEANEGNGSVDYATTSELGKRFHNFMIESTGNKRLIEILNNMNNHLDRIRTIFSLQYHDRYHEQILSEHLDIFNAVSEGDKEQAEKAMRQHIKNFWEILKSLL